LLLGKILDVQPGVQGTVEDVIVERVIHRQLGVLKPTGSDGAGGHQLARPVGVFPNLGRTLSQRAGNRTLGGQN
jgi:hypothetical protein